MGGNRNKQLKSWMINWNWSKKTAWMKVWKMIMAAIMRLTLLILYDTIRNLSIKYKMIWLDMMYKNVAFPIEDTALIIYYYHESVLLYHFCSALIVFQFPLLSINCTQSLNILWVTYSSYNWIKEIFFLFSYHWK